ncbi:uncharacterized protein LOC110006786 [Amborella trichopoda]|uniref:uncharacterized protein LOC110006786 n=1 Tax=Amborella trichopoda TaxID=13333 RepID=UPI0009BE714E|nr:uncharacterized protein LOC110006786 [Amborella trichopoda]|eukprot:XP_020519561.1 uncharacterized protein LOC110006786 [Amborella trichopoda]
MKFNCHGNSVSCSCHFFERIDLFCRHVLKIFMVKDMFEIPPQNIKKRWTKDVKKGIFLDEIGEQIQVTSKLPRSIRYNEVMQASQSFAKRASQNVEGYEFVMSIIKNGIHQFDEIFICKRGQNDNAMIYVNEDANFASCSNTPSGSNHCLNVLESARARTKRRSATKRMKARSEGWKLKKRKCTVCNGSGHDKRNCLSFVSDSAKDKTHRILWIHKSLIDLKFDLGSAFVILASVVHKSRRYEFLEDLVPHKVKASCRCFNSFSLYAMCCMLKNFCCMCVFIVHIWMGMNSRMRMAFSYLLSLLRISSGSCC